jgi:AAA family ATP:ADP antiporter
MRLRSLFDARDDEVAAVWWSFGYFFALLCGWYVLRPLRDASAADGGIDQLKWLFLVTLGAMLVVVPTYSALVARVPRPRLVPIVYRFFVANLILFYLGWQLGAPHVTLARVFYVWTAVYNVFVVSVFWSFMADLWTPEQGARLFGFIAAGGSLGAIAGPAASGVLVGVIGQAPLFLLSAALLEVAAQCAQRLARRAHGPAAPTGGSSFEAFGRVVRSRFLGGLAAQTLLYTATSTFLYLLQQHIVVAAIPDRIARTRFFSWRDTAVNVGTALVQAGATGAIVTRLGITVALAVTPLVTALVFGAAWLAPTLAVVTACQIGRNIIHYAVDRPAKELLWTAADRADKYKVKGFVDTVVYRFGDAAAGWLYAGLGAAAVAGGIPLALAWLAVNLFLARRFRARVQP